MSNKKDNPGVLTAPPLIYLAGLLIGLGLEALWPIPVLSQSVQYTAGLAVMAVSFVFAAWGFRTFAKAKTHLDVYKPTLAIITTGPFRYSRNPLYVSLTMLYVGIAILVDGGWILAMVVPTLVIIHYGVIIREEAYLAAKFPDTYLPYKARVRRWL